MQDTLNDLDVVPMTLPLMDRRNDKIVKEYLSFMALLLYGANDSSQVS